MKFAATDIDQKFDDISLDGYSCIVPGFLSFVTGRSGKLEQWEEGIEKFLECCVCL